MPSRRATRVAHVLTSVLLACALVVLAGACSGEDTEPAPPVPAPPFRHQDFYDTLQRDAEAFTQQGGDWLEDYGDAPFYGLAFYAHNIAASSGWQQKSDSGRQRALSLIDGASFFEDDVQELSMSALGLIEHVAATGDTSSLPVLDVFIDRMNALVGAVGWYLRPDVVDSWALRTYGSTSISALCGLINAEYAVRIGGEQAPRRIEWAVEMARKIREAAYDGQTYAFGPDRPGLFLYPNVAMIMLDGRLHRLTGEVEYRERAVRTHVGVQPLRLSYDPTRYYSPYSAAAMGATTTDYSTLSSHNYLMLALAVLFEITNDPAFVEELDSVVDAMAIELYGQWCLSHVHEAACTPVCGAGDVCVAASCTTERCQNGVLHHWIDGRPALPTDPEYFCSGCNLQLLYVMWYRKTRL